MKKSFAVAAVTALFAANSFATYIVVMKSGTTYKAKARPVVQNGKTLIALENGQSLSLDASLIDFGKSDQMTSAGLGDTKVLAVQEAPPPAAAPQRSTLGSAFHIRKGAAGNAAPVPEPAAPTAAAIAEPSGAGVSQEVIDKFQRAYENVGLFEYKVTPDGAGKIHVELTADSEDKVFNAISATAFLISKDAGVPGASIQLVELFMKTTMGGSSGRFQMTKADAIDLESKATSPQIWQDYFVRKVIF